MMRILVAAIVAVLLTSCGMQSGNVAALYWTRNINIEHWQQNTYKGASSVPAGGVEFDHHTVLSGFIKVGKTKVPVYRTTHDYRIWEWTPSRDLRTQGDAEVIPSWQEDYTLGENERVGVKTEEYHVIVHMTGSTCDATTNQAVWSSLEIGESVRTDCSSTVEN